MKKLISSTISFITSAALLMCAGFGATAAESLTESPVQSMEETELLLGEFDMSVMSLPEYPSLESNYSEGSYNYKDILDTNNLAVYNAFAKLNGPSVKSMTIRLPQTITFSVSALPGSPSFTEEDSATYEAAIFGNCKPGIDAAIFDIPELYWLEPSGINIGLGGDTTSTQNRWTGTYTLKVRTLVITPAYLTVFSSIDEAEEYGDKLSEAVDSFPVTGNDRYEQLKSIHDYIANFTYYDTSARFSSSPLGALVEPGVVCEGYSKAFKLMCDKLDIPCICVFGNMNYDINTGHMWNYVKMEDGNWYAMDVTWDDVDGENGREIKYDYFLKGSKSFFTNHTPETDFNITQFVYPDISEKNYVHTTSPNTGTTTTTTTITTTTSTTSSTSTTTTTSKTTTTTSSTTTTTSTTTSTTTTTSKTTTSTTTTSTTTTTTTTNTTTTTTSTTSTTTTTTTPPEPLEGDVNNDGNVNVADLVFYHRYLKGLEKANKYCDVNHDGTEDVFDLISLRRILIDLQSRST